MSDKPENVKCPDCDGPMLSRSGQFGRFWGCRNYPQCKGTRDSMGRSKADRESWKREQNKEDHEDIGPDSVLPSQRFNKKWSV